MPQGLCTYPGVTRVLSASYTYEHGIRPGVIHLTIPPSPSITQTGSVTFTYGAFSLVLANCLVEGIDKDVSNGEVWQVTLLDARWLWRFGQISGQYNVKIADKLLAETEKSSQELAELCLEAMGISSSNYDVTALPTDDTPAIDWQAVIPAQALADLCEEAGCRVIWKPNGDVLIAKTGTGASLPSGSLWTNSGVVPGAIPGFIFAATKRTVWQVDLPLVPVGLETDYTIVPIADLTYEPAETWAKADPLHFKTVAEANRALAKASVWKFYRINPTGTLGDGTSLNDLPNDVEPPDVERLMQLCPLESEQVETDLDTGVERARPPWVWGRWRSPARPGSGNNVTDTTWGARPARPDMVKKHKDWKLRYPGSFSIDKDTGLVRFADPIYRIVRTSDPAGIAFTSPDLFLRIAVSVRDKDTRAVHRSQKSYELSGVSGREKWIIRDDLQIRYYRDLATGNWVHNGTEIEAKLDKAAEDEAANYIQSAPATAEYAGFQSVALDGAISQATFTIDASGAARMTVSRLQEHTVGTHSYAERRRIEKTARALREADEARREGNVK